MSILYITCVGSTAAKTPFYWEGARQRFQYTESIVLCGRPQVDAVTRFLDPNSTLIVLEHPFRGAEGYREAIRDILKTVTSLITFYKKRGVELDEIVVNSTGGTEKMSCIIKDCVSILREVHPCVSHYWGSRDGYSEPEYTRKPEIDNADFLPPSGKFFPEPVEIPYYETNAVNTFTEVKGVPEVKTGKKKAFRYEASLQIKSGIAIPLIVSFLLIAGYEFLHGRPFGAGLSMFFAMLFFLDME